MVLMSRRGLISFLENCLEVVSVCLRRMLIVCHTQLMIVTLVGSVKEEFSCPDEVLGVFYVVSL